MHLQVQIRGAGVGAPHPLDVVCCCKRYLSDSRLSQAPILAIPFERCRSLGPPPQALRPLYKVGRKLAIGWLEFAELLLNEHPGSQSMTTSAQYLLDLVNGNLVYEPLPTLTFHDHPPSEAELTLNRLNMAPRANRQLLPVATFTCNIKRA